jgi:hypothetical protein
MRPELDEAEGGLMLYGTHLNDPVRSYLIDQFAGGRGRGCTAIYM